MELVLLSLIIAALAFCVTGFGVIIEYKSICISKGIQNWLMHESEARPTTVEEFNDYFNEEIQTDGGAMRRIDAYLVSVGARIRQGMHMSSMQEKSVESRTVNKYSTQIQNAVKQQMPIGYKIILKACEQIGLDLDEIIGKGELTEFLQAAKENRLDVLFANNGVATSSPSTQVPNMT